MIQEEVPLYLEKLHDGRYRAVHREWTVPSEENHHSDGLSVFKTSLGEYDDPFMATLMATLMTDLLYMVYASKWPQEKFAAVAAQLREQNVCLPIRT